MVDDALQRLYVEAEDLREASEGDPGWESEEEEHAELFLQNLQETPCRLWRGRQHELTRR